jgi:hypothetical protein
LIPLPAPIFASEVGEASVARDGFTNCPPFSKVGEKVPRSDAYLSMNAGGKSRKFVDWPRAARVT